MILIFVTFHILVMDRNLSLHATCHITSILLMEEILHDLGCTKPSK